MRKILSAHKLTLGQNIFLEHKMFKLQRKEAGKLY